MTFHQYMVARILSRSIKVFQGHYRTIRPLSFQSQSIPVLRPNHRTSLWWPCGYCFEEDADDISTKKRWFIDLNPFPNFPQGWWVWWPIWHTSDRKNQILYLCEPSCYGVDNHIFISGCCSASFRHHVREAVVMVGEWEWVWLMLV